jgi:hypothetical protein
VRRRNIDPDFFSSDQVISCSMEARLLFIGLWTIADREGRLRDEPTRIKRQLFPDDKTAVPKWLDELASAGLLDRYSVDDEPLICIPSFPDHQTIHPHEAASKLPPPPQKRDMSLQRQPLVEHVSLNSSLRNSSLRNSDTPKPPAGDVAVVFAKWIESTGRTTCKLDEKRRKVISARLKDYPLDDVLAAVQGWARDPWDGRRQQNEIAILLRDSAHLEKFRDLWRTPALAAVASGGHVDYDGPSELARKFW